MNKLIVIISTLMIGTLTLVAGVETNYFVMNTGEINNCTKINFKTNDIEVFYDNGTSVLIPKANIKAIRLNNVYYEKLPVYVNNLKTNQEELMQFVTTRAGLKLFKYSTAINNESGSVGFNVDGNQRERFLVFKGDQFYVEVTEKNYQTLFDFFKIKVKVS